MALDMSFLVADQDYYAPWDSAGPGALYHAAPMPDGWVRRDSGAWTHWGRPGLTGPDQGWKVHVSSSLPNAQAVLTVVSVACAELEVPFKHLSGLRMFLMAHDKHGTRVQSGKFCTLYPPTVERAERIMRRLETDLSGISGPFVLTDRRFGTSECVSYRYGAHRGGVRVQADGTRVYTILGVDGQEIEDQRTPGFVLPPGISDPFHVPKESGARGPVKLNGYTFDAVLRHSNAGGAYRFTDSGGEQVFVKEAKSHNGYTGDSEDAKARLFAEYLTLRAIHALAPGLCPRPVELFHHWEHSYLVSELVPGVSLYRWMVTQNPAIRIGPTAEEFTAYHRRALALLDQLEVQLNRLHELGYVFIDLSPTNVLVADDERIRLVDFEAVQRIDAAKRFMGTPGYRHPDPVAAVEHDPRDLDRYGLSALALLTVFPANDMAERCPEVLDHLHADLTEIGPIAPRLWSWATRNYERASHSLLPLPEEVRADPVKALHRLADRTADAMEAMARPDDPSRVYPTNPLGYQTDTRSVATGTAGVLHALHLADRACDPAVIRRLRDEALAEVENSAPGLLFGTAGVACVLAELGESDAADTLLAAAAKHPLNDTSATLGGGAAGTALGLLIHHRRTGEQHWLDLAQRLLERVPDGEPLAEQLNPTAQSGLAGGRTGLALALYRLHRQTGDSAALDRGLRMLREELTYAEPIEVGGIGFKTTHADKRVYPYLFAGSAGYAMVLARYLALRPDAELGVGLRATDVLEGCLRACTARFAVFPGLFPGVAGLALASADVGRRLGRPELIDAALTSARGLFRYAVPHENGVGWLGEPGQRFSAELWSGSAGILLALRHLTDAAEAAITDASTTNPETIDNQGKE